MTESSSPQNMGISEMLEQTDWYRNPFTNWRRVAHMSEQDRAEAVARLKKFALPMAQNVFSGLYSYGMPQGEQAQWELERGEAEAEHVTASRENAQQWMLHTPLCAALRGEQPYEDWEPLEDDEEATAPPLRADEQMRAELAELDKAIVRAEENLTYLRELRGRLAD